MQVDLLHQFTVKPLVSLHLFGADISYTNASLMMTLAVLLIVLLMHVVTRHEEIVPTKSQACFEQFYNLIFSTTRTYLGTSGGKFFPYIMGLFLFIFFGNTLGLIPYFFTFTSHIVVTLFLSIFVFIASIVAGLITHGWGFFRHFMPRGVPLYLAPLLVPVEIISFFSRPISLAVRLFANMVAGHVMLKVFAGFAAVLLTHEFLHFLSLAPIIVSIIINGFELMVCFLQAYVFTILTCIYLNEAIHIH